MAQPPGPRSSYDLDLDVLTGGEVRVKLGGRIVHLYAVFSNNDVAHFRRMLAREQANEALQQAAFQAVTTWRAESLLAQERGTPPPLAIDIEQYGLTNPAYYPQVEYERDLYNLLLSVWQKSESSKPEHERENVTPESVRDLSETQARQLLGRLWLRRNAPRVAPPAAVEQEPAPEPPAATAAATSTASTTAAPSTKGKGSGQRKRTSRSSAN